MKVQIGEQLYFFIAVEKTTMYVHLQRSPRARMAFTLAEWRSVHLHLHHEKSSSGTQLFPIGNEKWVLLTWNEFFVWVELRHFNRYGTECVKHALRLSNAEWNMLLDESRRMILDVRDGQHHPVAYKPPSPRLTLFNSLEEMNPQA
jgi:hypothetical protein